MEKLKDDITITKVQRQVKIDEAENDELIVKLDKSNGFSDGDTVIILHYKDFSNMIDVSTVSELKRKLESYSNSFRRVKELKMKLESAEIYYKEQLRDLKAQYNHQLSRLAKKIS